MDFTCAFSSLASSLLNSIADFLESGIDDFSTSLYNLTINDDSVDRSDPREKDTNKNNDSDTNDEVQDQQKMVIQDIRSEVQAIYIRYLSHDGESNSILYLSTIFVSCSGFVSLYGYCLMCRLCIFLRYLSHVQT